MKQIRIFSAESTYKLESIINLFFHEVNLYDWELISIEFETIRKIFFKFEYTVRILFKDNDGTS